MLRTLRLRPNLEGSLLCPKLHYITPTPQAAKTLGVPHHSLEELARQICRQNGLAIAPILTAHRTLQNAIGTALNVTDADGIARTWKGAVKSILRSGIDLETLESVNVGNCQQLARLTRTYQQQLKQIGTVDPVEVLWTASRLPVSPQPLAIYGYFHPQPDELAFVKAIASEGSIVVLPDESCHPFPQWQNAIETLLEAGWTLGAQPENLQGIFPQTPVRENAGSPQHPPSLSSVCYSYANPEAEVRGMLCQIKQLLHEGVPAKDIVLVARDDAFYGPMVLDVAWEYELPVRALYATPLNTTRLGAWVRSLLEVIRTNFPFEPTAKWLSHPLASSRLQPVWTQVRQRHPHTLQQWQEWIDTDLSILKWKSRSARTDWVKRLREVLEVFEVRQRCNRWAREIIAYYKLEEALDAIAQPKDQRLKLEEFAREVTDTLNLLTVPAQPGRGGVELHSPKALSGARYPYVFVLGMAEGIFPAPLKDDPVLDFYTRKRLIRLGLPLEDATQVVRRESLSFEGLLEVATHTLTFSYLQRIGKEEMLPSPYLAKLNLKPHVAKAIAVASPEEARKVDLAGLRDTGTAGRVAFDDPVFDRAVRAWTVENRRETAMPDYEHNGAVAIAIDPQHHVFSASQLTQLGQCGFKWFAGYLLKLAELTEADTEFDGKLRGRFYHKTLELVVQKARGRANLRQGLLDALEEAFSEAEKSENLLGISTWDARRAEHLSLLRRTIAHDTFLSADTEVLGVELKFRGQWYGFNVEGIIDRIDSTPEGLHLIEYKNLSSKPTAAKDTSGKANLDVQLPLYQQVAAAALFPDRPVAQAYYYSISKQKKMEAEAEETQLKEFAHRIGHQLKQGHFPVEPDIEGKACQYCDRDLVCRKGVEGTGKSLTP